MKTCPVCNDSFADELNFCDIDGVRLNREGVPEDRNKWWSLVGAGLLIGAVVISAMTIFLPKARVATPPVANQEAAPAQTAPKPATPSEPVTSVASATPEPEASPEKSAADVSSNELKRKDKGLTTPATGGPVPNPKAAAQSAEDADKPAVEVRKSEPAPARPPEAPPAVRTSKETRSSDSISKPATPAPELRGEKQPPSSSSKGNDKNPNDKKKSNDKEKKKGGFLNVFKKIFGKD